jgi:hypothetical protein
MDTLKVNSSGSMSSLVSSEQASNLEDDNLSFTNDNEVNLMKIKIAIFSQQFSRQNSWMKF